MRAGILRLGREQLAEAGAAGLSVREIARGLGVASSAIYRHVANRDALLTLLVVDAYTELADAVAGTADAGAPSAQQLDLLARSMREWGITHPESWALIYGSPVPGYAAPARETTPAGTRVMLRFLAVLAAGDPERRAAPAASASAGLVRELRAGVADADGGTELTRIVDAEPAFAADAVEAWTGLVGLVSAEVFKQLGPGLVPFGAEMLERWVASTSARFGLSR